MAVPKSQSYQWQGGNSNLCPLIVNSEFFLIAQEMGGPLG